MFDREPVTLLKPLYGAEPDLSENLASFLAQPWGAPLQMVCGVQRAEDPAIDVVAEVQARHPDAAIDLVRDDRAIGANAKISNLAHCVQQARHDVLILSDSDIAVGPDYLPAVMAALVRPGAGAVTCLYRGVGIQGIWSRLVALGIDLHFLPSALIGLATGLAHPCMGSTIALRRETLERIGGFEAFADVLADDHAIGAAVRGLGLTMEVPDMLVTHSCGERSLGDLWRHELRWNATIRSVDPAGYAGSFILHPLPLALLGMAMGGWLVTGGIAILLAIAVRGAIALRLDHRPLPVLLLAPIRDLLSFALFLSSWRARSVDWRGAQLRIESQGRISTELENSR